MHLSCAEAEDSDIYDADIDDNDKDMLNDIKDKDFYDLDDDPL